MDKEAQPTFDTPLLPRWTFPQTRMGTEQAAEVWSWLYHEAQSRAHLLSTNWRPQESGLYNPEYLLPDWSSLIVDFNRLQDDVMGWAYRALEREQEFCLRQLSPEQRAASLGWKPEDARYLKGAPIPPEMLKKSQALYFFTRYKEWASARLGYHRLALRLTFYKQDSLAGCAPICNSRTRLRERLRDWRDITIAQQQDLFEREAKKSGRRLPARDHLIGQVAEAYWVDFLCWMKDEGVRSKAISWEAINWLCWLQLVAPIAKDWEPREAAIAARKMFLGEGFRAKAAEWWKNPPKVTYEPPIEGDDWATKVAKHSIPKEFSEFVEDFVSNELADVKSFTNTLTKQLNEYHIPHRGSRGRPVKDSGMEIPAEWNAARHLSPQEGYVRLLAILLRKDKPSDTFDPTNATNDLEKDEPTGWLAARHITV